MNTFDFLYFSTIINLSIIIIAVCCMLIGVGQLITSDYISGLFFICVSFLLLGSYSLIKIEVPNLKDGNNINVIK